MAKEELGTIDLKYTELQKERDMLKLKVEWLESLLKESGMTPEQLEVAHKEAEEKESEMV